MYYVELGELKWSYETALEAWNNNAALQIRKSSPPMHLDNGAITGVKTFEEFRHLLDEGTMLQYHSLRVYKVNDIQVKPNKEVTYARHYVLLY